MMWFLWRRQRTPLLIAAALIMLAAPILLVAHLALLSDAHALGIRACLDTSDLCTRDTTPAGIRVYNPLVTPWFNLETRYLSIGTELQNGMWLLAPVLGWLCGVGLYGHELQHRTHILALTQATTRLRWWATGLLSILPVLILLTGVTAFATWALHPYVELNQIHRVRIAAPAFDYTGLAPSGYLLLAFALAATAGLVAGNTTTGSVATGLVFAVVFTALLLTRYSYFPDRVALAPITYTSTGELRIAESLPEHSYVQKTEFLDARRRVVPLGDSFRRCEFAQEEGPANGRTDCFRAAGITQQARWYQPDSYYWPLQTITFAVTALLAVLTTAAGWLTFRPRRTEPPAPAQG